MENLAEEVYQERKTSSNSIVVSNEPAFEEDQRTVDFADGIKFIIDADS